MPDLSLLVQEYILVNDVILVIKVNLVNLNQQETLRMKVDTIVRYNLKQLLITCEGFRCKTHYIHFASAPAWM